jgi:two-component system, OmpR family, response regulator MprA
MSSRVLLVDDDPSVVSTLESALETDGYDVLTARDGTTALAVAERRGPDLVVLDVSLPDLDGLEVCSRLRANSSTPILMVSARSAVPDLVAGLDRGDDDYLAKPFSLDELLARVRALLRRTRLESGRLLQYADITLDLAAREAARDGVALQLTPRELELLAFFLRHPGQAVSRVELSEQVWGYPFLDGAGSNFIDVAVKGLRKKLEAGGRPRLIQTVWGHGYILREA